MVCPYFAFCVFALLTCLLLEAHPWDLYPNYLTLSFSPSGDPQWGANPPEAMALHCTESLNKALQLSSSAEALSKEPKVEEQEQGPLWNSSGLGMGIIIQKCPSLSIYYWGSLEYPFPIQIQSFTRQGRLCLYLWSFGLLFWRHSVGHGKCCSAPKEEIRNSFLQKIWVCIKLSTMWAWASWKFLIFLNRSD